MSVALLGLPIWAWPVLGVLAFIAAIVMTQLVIFDNEWKAQHLYSFDHRVRRCGCPPSSYPTKSS